MRSLGFAEVMELPHAQVVQLAPGVRVASYQNGPDDSVFVVADGEHVLVDINDGKIRGRTLQRILDEFGRPTFVFKSYSFAQAYPVLYTADDPADLELVTRDTYLDNWVRVVDALEPALRRALRQHGGVPPSREPGRERAARSRRARSSTRSGSSRPTRPPRRCRWTRATAGAPTPASSSQASTGTPTAPRTSRSSRRRWRPRSPIRRSRRRASRSTSPTFADYFDGFMHAFPPGVLGRSCCTARWCSRSPSSPLPFWVLDFSRRAVYRLSAPPPDTASIVSVNEGVLADAIAKRLVHVVHGSMRIHVHLRPGGAGDDLMFWGLVVPWELGYLPLRRILRPRLAEVAWRRRGEVARAARRVRAVAARCFDRVSGRRVTYG